MQIKKETVTKFLRKDLLLWNFSNLLWNYQIAVGNFSLNDKLAFAKPITCNNFVTITVFCSDFLITAGFCITSFQYYYVKV